MQNQVDFVDRLGTDGNATPTRAVDATEQKPQKATIYGAIKRLLIIMAPKCPDSQRKFSKSKKLEQLCTGTLERYSETVSAEFAPFFSLNVTLL